MDSSGFSDVMSSLVGHGRNGGIHSMEKQNPVRANGLAKSEATSPALGPRNAAGAVLAFARQSRCRLRLRTGAEPCRLH